MIIGIITCHFWLVDIWIAIHPDNAQKVVAVLKIFGFENDPDLKPEMFLQEKKIIRMGFPPLRLEITTSISGVEFEDCYQARIVDELDGIEVNLIDLENLKKNKNRDDYQPASLSFTDENGQLISWDLEIKPRGKMRRRVCAMPPLKLKFPKDEVKAQGLAKYRTLEMVEICNSGKDYEQYVLREYVAYKLYNMLTNNSFRVQLVKVDFQDAEAEKIPMDGFGFLIENNEEMAERLGASTQCHSAAAFSLSLRVSLPLGEREAPTCRISIWQLRIFFSNCAASPEKHFVTNERRQSLLISTFSNLNLEPFSHK